MGNQINLTNLTTQAIETGMLVGECDTLAVLLYEIGEIAKCIVYTAAAANKDDFRSARLYERLLAPALADSLMQLRLLAYEHNLDFDELIADGLERFKQRIRDRGGDA